MMKRSFNLLALLVLFCTISVNRAFSQNIPDRPNPPRLVNDFAGMLNAQEVSMLEQKLLAFNDSTSTQMVILTVPTLDGYDKADYANGSLRNGVSVRKAKTMGCLYWLSQKQLIQGVRYRFPRVMALRVLFQIFLVEK